MFSNKNERGIMSLVVIFVVGFFGLGVALTIATIALLGIDKNINTKSGSQSFYTAEAATREGAYQCINSFYVDPSNFCLDSINAIPFDINMVSGTTTIRNLTWPYVEIKSVANNNLTQHEVVYNLTKFAEGLAFDKAVYSENTINVHGGANMNIIGNIFANGGVDCNGNPNIEGDVASAGQVTNCDNADSEISNATPIPPPEIDLQDYFDEKDQYLENGTHDITINSEYEGIIFASTTKDVIVNINHIGALVAKCDELEIRGNYEASSLYATSIAIVVYGDLTIKGDTTIKGIVYVKGTTRFDGGGHDINIDGALISTGPIDDVTLGGSVRVEYNEDAVKNWSEALGLITTPSDAPRIIGWQEQ